MTALIISAVVGVFLPALVALVTKEHLPTLPKQVVLILLASVTGVASGLAGSPPSGLNQWEHVGISILIAFVAAVQSQFGASEVHAVVGRKSASFGIG
jgi:hypothetical protein